MYWYDCSLDFYFNPKINIYLLDLAYEFLIRYQKAYNTWRVVSWSYKGMQIDDPHLTLFHKTIYSMISGLIFSGKYLLIVWTSPLLIIIFCFSSLESLSGDRLLVLVNVFGTIKFEQHPTHIFSETFFLTQESNLWRVQSVTFRFID